MMPKPELPKPSNSSVMPASTGSASKAKTVSSTRKTATLPT